MFDPEAAEGVEAGYQLRLAEQAFAVRIAEGRLELSRGELRAPNAVIDTDPATLAALLWHGYELGDAIASGSLRIEGSGAPWPVS
jgi:hypothetical protein